MPQVSVVFKALKGSTHSYLSDFFSIRGTDGIICKFGNENKFAQATNKTTKKLLLQWGAIIE